MSRLSAHAAAVDSYDNMPGRVLTDWQDSKLQRVDQDLAAATVAELPLLEAISERLTEWQLCNEDILHGNTSPRYNEDLNRRKTARSAFEVTDSADESGRKGRDPWNLIHKVANDRAVKAEGGRPMSASISRVGRDHPDQDAHIGESVRWAENNVEGWSEQRDQYDSWLAGRSTDAAELADEQHGISCELMTEQAIEQFDDEVSFGIHDLDDEGEEVALSAGVVATYQSLRAIQQRVVSRIGELRGGDLAIDGPKLSQDGSRELATADWKVRMMRIKFGSPVSTIHDWTSNRVEDAAYERRK